MTPAEHKNLKALVGKLVEIKWRDPLDDWPYFVLLKVKRGDDAIYLRGADFPDGSGTHDGDEFWTDWSGVVSIKEVPCAK